MRRLSITGELLSPHEMANLLGNEFCTELRLQALSLSKNKPRFMELVMDTTQTVERTQSIEKLKSGVIRALQVEGTLPHEFTELYQLGFQNCSGFWVKKGKCRTDACQEARACNDKQGYCRPCKIAKGMMTAPHVVQKRTPYKFTESELEVIRQRELTSKVRVVETIDQISKPVMQESLVDAAHAFILRFDRDTLVKELLAVWSQIPISLRQEVVTKVMKSSNVIAFPDQGALNEFSVDLPASHGSGLA